MNQSPTNSMNHGDWKQWGKNTLLFSAPALLAFLMTLQGAVVQGSPPTHEQLLFAFGAGYSALLGSIIDLVKKYTAGQPVIQ